MNLSILLLSPAFVLVFKWTALLTLGWSAHWLLRRRHARWRLILWRSLLCFGLVLPLLQFMEVPGIKIPIRTNQIQSADLGDLSAPIATSKPAQPVSEPVSAKAPVAIQSVSSGEHPSLPAPPRPVSWGEILVVIWALGFLSGAARLVWLQWTLSRLRREAHPPAPAIQFLAREVQTGLKIRQRVEIQTTDAITSPFVCGLLKPTIMLPRLLAQDLAPGELRALLNHEMAHVRQHDLAWSVAWQWMKIVCWFHPLAWRVPAAHNFACEQEADRVASGQMAGQDSYAQLLARLALRVLALPVVETRLTVNGSSQIAKRLKLLGQSGVKAWNWRHSVAAFSIAGLLFLVVAGCKTANTSPAGPSGSEGGAKVEMKTVLVVVQDEDGKPIQGATISPEGFRVKGIHGADANNWRKDLFGPPEKAVTDAEGKAYIKYPVEGIPEEKEYTSQLYFTVTHPDYSTARPEEYSVDTPEEPIRLTRGIHLKVSGYTGSDHQSVPELVPNLSEEIIHTNDWQTDDHNAYTFNKVTPGDHLLQLTGRLPSGEIVYSDTIEINAEKGKEYNFDLEMKPGIRLEGRLDDNVPRPVKNGRVLICVRPKEFPAWTNWNQVDAVFKKYPNCHFWKSYRMIAEDGTFVFESVPPGGLDVIALGDGFASKNGGFYARNFGVPQTFPMEAPTTKIEVATEPTATLEFTAKTKAGKPVEGARVGLNPNVIRIGGGLFGDMRQSSEEPFHKLPPLPDVPYSTKTDQHGIAVIRNVPACTGGMEVDHPQFQVPIQEPRGWRDRHVRVSFTAGATNKLTMTLEPKGTDYIGTAR